MADKKQLKMLKDGVAGWNKWRLENPDAEIDLSKASMFEADLAEANLNGADLREAYLCRALLCRANLIRANLEGADLVAANLSAANLSGANLEGAHLEFAYLSEANCYRADLTDAKLMFSNCSAANLNEASLTSADLKGANLSNASLLAADLRIARVLFSNLQGANLNHCKVYGAAIWDIEVNDATEQSELVVTREDQPTVTVDDLEVAQFMYLLLNRANLRKVLNSATRNGVLILGRFRDGGLEVLQAIAEKLRELGYVPMLFDFEPSDKRDWTETVTTMVGIANFVIADLTGPSVLKELEATVPHFEVPFVPIIQAGRKSASMTVDLTKYPWFWWPPIKFASKETLVEKLQETIIAPVEVIQKKKRERLQRLYADRK